MEAISKYITYAKAVWSDTAIRRGIVNKPGTREMRAMKLVGEMIHSIVSNHFGFSIPFASFFRSNVLNRIIGGSDSSQHVKGEAIDLDADGTSITNAQLFYWILENLKFDQLIWEYGDKQNPAWVHVSYVDPTIRANRRQVLRAIRVNGKTQYVPFDLGVKSF